MSQTEALEIIDTIRLEIEQAADTMLAATEKGLRDLGAARSGDVAAFDNLERMLCAILEACAFQDLTGQRLSKLRGMIGPIPNAAAPADPLLNGPAARGAQLPQALIDEIMLGANLPRQPTTR